MKRIILALFLAAGLVSQTAQADAAVKHDDRVVIEAALETVRYRLDMSQVSDVLTGLRIYQDAIKKRLSSEGRSSLDTILLRTAKEAYDDGVLDSALEQYRALLEKALN